MRLCTTEEVQTKNCCDSNCDNQGEAWTSDVIQGNYMVIFDFEWEKKDVYIFNSRQ